MKLSQIILELICPSECGDPCPCSQGLRNPSIECLSSTPDGRRCPNLLFRAIGNQLAYSDYEGTIDPESGIEFGGEMLPRIADADKLTEVWTRLCNEMIQDAYKRYMEMLKPE